MTDHVGNRSTRPSDRTPNPSATTNAAAGEIHCSARALVETRGPRMPQRCHEPSFARRRRSGDEDRHPSAKVTFTTAVTSLSRVDVSYVPVSLTCVELGE